mgnify:CR=1 FL=1
MQLTALPVTVPGVASGAARNPQLGEIMRMIRKLPAVVLALAMAAGPLAAMTLEGIRIPDRMAVDSVTLSLNGAGVRSKFFIEVYVACLYLEAPSEDPVAILTADEPQAVTLHITSKLVTREKLAKAARKGMLKATGGDLEPIRAQFERFMRVFDAEVSKGDVFRLVYVPGSGTRVTKNNRNLDTVPGLAFKKALFGIWLSEDPTEQDLKESMLKTRTAST